MDQGRDWNQAEGGMRKKIGRVGIEQGMEFTELGGMK